MCSEFDQKLFYNFDGYIANRPTLGRLINTAAKPITPVTGDEVLVFTIDAIINRQDVAFDEFAAEILGDFDALAASHLVGCSNEQPIGMGLDISAYL